MNATRRNSEGHRWRSRSMRVATTPVLDPDAGRRRQGAGDLLEQAVLGEPVAAWRRLSGPTMNTAVDVVRPVAPTTRRRWSFALAPEEAGGQRGHG